MEIARKKRINRYKNGVSRYRIDDQYLYTCILDIYIYNKSDFPYQNSAKKATDSNKQRNFDATKSAY